METMAADHARDKVANVVATSLNGSGPVRVVEVSLGEEIQVVRCALGQPLPLRTGPALFKETSTTLADSSRDKRRRQTSLQSIVLPALANITVLAGAAPYGLATILLKGTLAARKTGITTTEYLPEHG